MNHNFDVKLAERYGILEAVIINYFHFWIEKNRANEQNFHDGYYWTYNSMKAFTMLFPYATENQIRYALKKLKDEEIIQVGNYNKAGFDRTLWYAFTDYGLSLVSDSQMDLTISQNASEKNNECICENSQMDLTNLTNGFDTIPKPIPVNKPFNKPFDDTDNDTDNAKPSLVELYQKLCPRLKPYSENQLKPDLTGIAKEIQINGMDIEKVFKMANESDFLAGVGGGWQADFRWLMVVGNAKKVLAGNYQNKESKKKPSFDQRTYDYDALERAMMKKRDERLKGD